ncbi:hypothetical protein [Nocardia sp. NPDC050793]|uniref:hypothetical protein n=1 Tax=Nocardia sp. NPDC050793 TaxID=3155159 RepID=UPI0033E9E13A
MSLGDALGLSKSPNFLPKYHGEEGDTRYPSPRKLRSLGATLIDFVLQFGSIVAMGLPLVMVEIPRPYSYSVLLIPVVVLGGNRILLPKWVHASVGELIFGLVEIRGSDGAWPGWRDLRRGHGNGRDGLPNLVNVRRCDV